jgi:hypothetical protein
MLTSCSIGYRFPTVYEALGLEKELTTGLTLNVTVNDKVRKSLTTALIFSSLPHDYANIVIIDTPYPVMSSGVSNEIYLSESFIYYVLNDYFSELELVCFFIHELAHKELNHAYELLSKPQFYSAYQKLKFNDLLNIAYLKLLSPGLSLKDSYQASQLLNIHNNNGIRNFKHAGYFEFSGYPYTEKMEYKADEIVKTILNKNLISIELYANALRKLQNIYEDRYLMNNNAAIKLISSRVRKLNLED